MIKSDLLTIIVNLENILKIDSSDMKLTFDEILTNVCFRISKNYGMTIERGSFDYSSDNVTTEFRTAVETGNNALCVYNACMSIYSNQDFITLQDVKYCGNTKDSMLRFLLYLSKDDYVREVNTEIKKIESKIHQIIEISAAKRLLIILCICYELKIWFTVNLIASILWLGDVKESSYV